MDSKFGPDGALYVQIYDGFFRAGPNVGICRYDYVGGPPTPGAAPQGVPDRGLRGRSFASARLGRRVLRVGLRRRQRPRPRRTRRTSYAEAGRYTATLTVTYADGSTDSEDVTSTCIAEPDDGGAGDDGDDRPGRPERDQAGDGHADGDRRPPAAASTRTEYRVNGGDWQEYTGAVQRSEPGEYTVEYRSMDRASNEEDRQDAHVHDLGDPELHAGPQRRVRRHGARATLGRSLRPPTTTARSRSPTASSRCRSARAT